MSEKLDRILIAVAGAIILLVGIRRKIPGYGLSGGLFLVSAFIPFDDDDGWDKRGERPDVPDPVSSGMEPSPNGRGARRVVPDEPMPEPIARRISGGVPSTSE